MDIYSQKSRWKIYLALAGVVIVLISLFYTKYLTDRLAEEEEKRATFIVKAFEEVNKELPPECLNSCSQCVDFTYPTEILTTNTTIPAILVSNTGAIHQGVNFGESLDYDIDYLESVLRKWQDEGVQPVKGESQYIYYVNSNLLVLLKYFPFIQLLLIAAFILFGYLAFSSARRAEENRVWVGMAKETAHQLGTPISGILGWINHLQMVKEDDEEVQEIVNELIKDVDRLELVADRFSKIGSEPKLVPVNVYQELDKLKVYMQARSPRKVSYEFPRADAGDVTIFINSHLFDWVVENLMRNALDAMEGKGVISASVFYDNEFTYIDISDTGKGIPQNKFKTVFSPGFTTKKRGWGLGLSLAKRIVEEYHSGKIFVKKSTLGEGTTFTIQLPKELDSK